MKTSVASCKISRLCCGIVFYRTHHVAPARVHSRQEKGIVGGRERGSGAGRQGASLTSAPINAVVNQSL